MNNKYIHEQYEEDEKLKEECGVFGIYDFDGGDVASTIYYGLFALQHRGQESCGIAVSDTNGPKGSVKSHKGMGLVNEVFTPELLEGFVWRSEIRIPGSEAGTGRRESWSGTGTICWKRNRRQRENQRKSPGSILGIWCLTQKNTTGRW